MRQLASFENSNPKPSAPKEVENPKPQKDTKDLKNQENTQIPEMSKSFCPPKKKIKKH